MTDKILEWIKVVGPIVISWPTVVLIFIFLFKALLLALLKRFTESEGSKAEIGPFKIELGNPVLPPQYRGATIKPEVEKIDLGKLIGSIGDTGPEGTTVGFAVAYALQAAIEARTGDSVVLSPRSIYSIAKKYDEWPGEDYEGTSVLGALDGLKEVGAYLESGWPYSMKKNPKKGTKPAYKISGYTKLEGIEQVLNALREGKAVIATIAVSDDFDKTDAKGRVVIKLPLRQIGAKAICVVGYDGESAEFKFANDWGTGWGDNGFGLIRDTDLAKILQSAYSLEL